jgi:hypothetical protein
MAPNRLFLSLFVLLPLISALQVGPSKRKPQPPFTIRSRRDVLFHVAAIGLIGGPSIAKAQNEPSKEEEEDSRVYRLLSGVQFRNVRIGSGPLVTKESGTLVLHLRASTRGGSVLLDTREDGPPLLYKLGSAQDYNVFGGDSAKRLKVTQGVEDAIVSRGILEKGEKVEPMREGGIRKVIVPSFLAYGNTGVSRYDSYRMGLRKVVPRDEVLLYEVEILRCLNVEVPLPPRKGQAEGTTETITVQACCTEDSYPCQAPLSRGDPSGTP